MVETDTFARLPAVTRVLPAIRLQEAARSSSHAPPQPREGMIAQAPVQKLDEATRWSRWGAARDGAVVTLSSRQSVALIGGVAFVLAFALLNPIALLTASIACITVLYVVAGLYKAMMLIRGERASGGLTVHPYAIADADLPVYTVLAPLFHEGVFAPELVRQLMKLDYPSDRLEVLLLVEEEDSETRIALEQCSLPSHIHILTVPDGMPRTKPRALNVGLAYSTGEFIVIYDVEDRPEPDQLRKAVASFRSLPRRVVCLQARLNYFNRHQSLLTRLFSIDYSIWYDMLLPGLMRKNAVIPLGGTSNHFRRSVLQRLGGWDPFNVTEDADLGVRISRVNLQVMMLDSVTWEEAVAGVPQWLRQRSRWVKGYMQTYLVHMRHPITLIRDLGPTSFGDFQLLIGGTSLMLLINPIMWALTVLYFATKNMPVGSLIHTLFPPPIYYGALACLLANYFFFYSQLYVVVRRGYHDLARYAILGPLYWLLMSLGAWAGLFSLIRNPHYWAKTQHGSSLALKGQETPAALAIESAVDLQRSAVVAAPETATNHARISTFPAPVVSLWRPGKLTTYSLSVILPAYNEEANIAETVRSVVDVLTQWGLDFELLVINDGSKDRTGEILAELSAKDLRIRPVTHQVNRGYGAALVTGFESARMDLAFFMDSDGQFDINELAQFFPLIERYDAVLGYRIDRKDATMRLINAWGWKQLVRLFLGVRVRDVDCAFKLFHTDFFVTHRLESRGAMINAEILYKLHRDAYRVTEIGVHHLERRAGKATGAKLRVILRAFKELFTYSLNWRIAEWRWNQTSDVIVDID